MCHPTETRLTRSDNHATKDSQPFPWHHGVCDAHCHPTDTMSSISLIRSKMRARALTVMATRGQDQQLVADVAAKIGLENQDSLDGEQGVIVPSFGWHPWFSHQIYDDTTEENQASVAVSAEKIEKRKHYQAVLAPPPKDNDAIIQGLPEPRSLSELISTMREYLRSHPLALVGEIGLDKAFRLPMAWSASDDEPRDDGLTPGGREGRRLSPHRVRPDHQQAVLQAQLRLAGEMGRAVSVHGVQAHGLLFDTVAKCWKGHEKEVLSRRKRRLAADNAEESDSDDEPSHITGPKPYPPRICLHSFSAGPEVLKQWLNPTIPARIFFSFSVAVNLSTDNARERLEEVLRNTPDDQILIESDLHTAGEDMDNMLEEMYRFVCEIKAWSLEDGVRRIRKTYEQFIFG